MKRKGKAVATPFIEVSGRVSDSIGLTYANGTITPTLNSSGSPTLDGAPYTPPSQPFGLDANGRFAFNLAPNDRLLPAGSTWSFTVCSAAGTVPIAWGRQSVCFQVQNLVLNASQDISGELITKAEPLTYSASFLASASSDIPLVHGLVDFDFENLDSAGKATVEPADLGSQDAVGIAVNVSGAEFPPIVQVATALVVPCICDNQSEVGHFVTSSSSVRGQCHDYGDDLSTSLATYGQVVRANNGPHTATLIYISPFLSRAGGGGNGGGTGTVTMVASGSLTPLFNVNVANPTTTPTFSFIPVVHPANRLFGTLQDGGGGFFQPSGDVIFDGDFLVKGLHFGDTPVPLGATPPAAGELLSYDGSSIVGTSFPLQVIARGTFTLPAGTAAPNALTLYNQGVSGGVAVGDVVVWNNTAGYSVHPGAGWTEGNLTLMIKTTGNVLAVYIGNASSTPVAYSALPIAYMVLR